MPDLSSGTVSALLTHPTGGGKTYLALQATKAVLARGDRVLVLLPLRALATEVETQWQAALPDVTVRAYMGDRVNSIPYCDPQVIIMTADRLELLLRSWRRHHRWLARIALIVADELHTLADPGRGARLDMALTRLRALLPKVTVLGLTATCGNPDDISAWLEGVHEPGGERPVPLHWSVQRVKRPQDKASVLLDRLVPGEPTLVFVHSRVRTMELAAQLREAGHAAQAHHGALTAEERANVEAQMRSGTLSILVCTSTLELGINLPVWHVVLYDLTLWGPGGQAQPLSINAAWQRAGRAGRTRGPDQARVTVIGTSREEPEQYVIPNYEPIQSTLRESPALLDFILGSVDGGWVRTRPQLERLLAGTLAARQGRLDTAQTLCDLIHGGALEETDELVRITPLGRVASQAMLPVLTVKAVQFLPLEPTVLDVFLLACGRGDVPVPRLPEDTFAVVEALIQLTPSRLLDAREWVQPEVLNAAAVLLSVCQEGEQEAAETFGLSVPQVRAFREQVLRVVEAWLKYQPSQKLALVRTMLAAQLPLSAATLALLPGVGSVTARKLAHAGFEDVEALALADPAEVTVPGISPPRLLQLIECAERLVKTFPDDLTREPTPGPRDDFRLDWRDSIDPIRLQRSLALSVTPTSGGFIVTGGAAPHFVSADLTCDCLDHTRTRQCKHVLAVLRGQQQSNVVRNIALLTV